MKSAFLIFVPVLFSACFSYAGGGSVTCFYPEVSVSDARTVAASTIQMFQAHGYVQTKETQWDACRDGVTFAFRNAKGVIKAIDVTNHGNDGGPATKLVLAVRSYLRCELAGADYTIPCDQ